MAPAGSAGARCVRDRESVRAVLIDIDGVLTVSWEPLPGGVEALRRIRPALVEGRAVGAGEVLVHAEEFTQAGAVGGDQAGSARGPAIRAC